jgi:carbon starvation protein
VTALGFPVSTEQMSKLAETVGEKSLFGRTGGAATLAVGMAGIFSSVVGNRWVDLWYHFAIMFEALFILTTLDAGTRVGRYLLQDVLGRRWQPLGETRSIGANVLASLLVVAGWGYFLIQGVRDPLGGINSLWPLFGMANQLLAAIALCLATTVILKMQLSPRAGSGVEGAKSKAGRPAFALITLTPLLWLLSVTMTAGVEKIFHDDPGIGFLKQAAVLQEQLPGLQRTLAAVQATGETARIGAALKAIASNRAQHFNNLLDAVVAGFFLTLVVMIVLLSVREWVLLLARKRLATLHETAPVWLPDYALADGKPLRLFGLFALALALAKEWSGETALERAQETARTCECGQPDRVGAGIRPVSSLPGERPPADQRRTRQRLQNELAERKFNGINRCC